MPRVRTMATNATGSVGTELKSIAAMARDRKNEAIAPTDIPMSARRRVFTITLSCTLDVIEPRAIRTPIS